MKQLHVRCSFLLVAAIMCSCQKPVDLPTLESQAASYMNKGLRAFANEVPGVKVTNTLQLFHYATTNSGIWGYPHWLEWKFRQFGKEAGFTNSLFEKYVVSPPGIKLHLGELVMLSAHAYQGIDGKPSREVICYNGEHYINYTYSEQEIQDAFKIAGLVIPKASPLPPPPPAPAFSEYRSPLTVKGVFERIAEGVGLEHYHWLTVLGTLIIVIVMIAFVILFLRFSRR